VRFLFEDAWALVSILPPGRDNRNFLHQGSFSEGRFPPHSPPLDLRSSNFHSFPFSNTVTLPPPPPCPPSLFRAERRDHVPSTNAMSPISSTFRPVFFFGEMSDGAFIAFEKGFFFPSNTPRGGIWFRWTCFGFFFCVDEVLGGDVFFGKGWQSS